MVSDIYTWLGAIPDPEIPVLSILDLGIVRDVRQTSPGSVTVTVTPTYSGCPAMDQIRADIESTLRSHGIAQVTVETVFSPAWTTDWIPAAAKARLREFGIGPPAALVQLNAPVPCPRCGSASTELVSRFASTACKSHYKCRACLEPFDAFKPH